MNNAADILTFVVAGMCLVALVSMMSLMLPGVKVLKTGDIFFRGRFLIGLVMFTYLKIVFLTMLNFSNFEVYSPDSGFSSFFALGAAVYVIAIPLFYVF